MEITSWHETGKARVTILQLTGDLVAQEALEARARAEYADGARDMVLDLSGVPYISSAGLRAIHAVYLLLRSADVSDEAAAASGLVRGTYRSPHLKLVKPSRNGLKALSTAGYDMFLEIHDSIKSAVQSF